MNTLKVENPYRDSGRTPAYHESVIEAATTTAHLAFNEGVKADRTAVVAWLKGICDNSHHRGWCSERRMCPDCIAELEPKA